MTKNVQVRKQIRKECWVIFFCKQKGIDDATHWVSDCPLATAPEKAEIVEKMKRGINRQVQAKEAEAQEEKGT